MKPGGLLALDIATISGFAYGLPGNRPIWGHFRSGRRGAEAGEVLLDWRDWLITACGDWAPRGIAFESPYVPRVQPRQVRTVTGQRVFTLPPKTPPIDIAVLRRLISMCGLVEMIACDNGIDCYEAAANEICKHFTGHGSWGGREAKKAATQRMCAFYGWRNVTEDEADALALWVYFEAVLFPGAGRARGAGPLFINTG